MMPISARLAQIEEDERLKDESQRKEPLTVRIRELELMNAALQRENSEFSHEIEKKDRIIRELTQKVNELEEKLKQEG